MGQFKIPLPAIGVVGEVIGHHHYSHRRLNVLFMEHGAPGEPPPGNCVDQCVEWLKQCNEDRQVDALSVLGAVIADSMEFEISEFMPMPEGQAGQERITKVLARCGLSYLFGGRVVSAGTAPSAKTLRENLKARDLAAVEAEFQRALDSVATDPAAGVTAACALLESLCKVYIEDEGLEMPPKETLEPLWKVVADPPGIRPVAARGRRPEADLVGTHVHRGRDRRTADARGLRPRPRENRLPDRAAPRPACRQRSARGRAIRARPRRKLPPGTRKSPHSRLLRLGIARALRPKPAEDAEIFPASPKFFEENA